MGTISSITANMALSMGGAGVDPASQSHSVPPQVPAQGAEAESATRDIEITNEELKHIAIAAQKSLVRLDLTALKVETLLQMLPTRLQVLDLSKKPEVKAP